MAGGVDRLSDLPDELLLRVLHFVPGKQAAATTALSRRWRSPLWRSSGAVNLETHVEDWGYYTLVHNDKSGRWDDRLFLSRRDAFVSAAEAAFDAADVPVARLTLRVTGHNCIDLFLNGDWDVKLSSPWSPHYGALAKLLSHRAVCRVEELRLEAHDVYSDGQTSLSSLGLYALNLGSVQSENLRVLDLTNCFELVPPASAVVFPRLSSLRLHHGTVRLDALQSLLYAAPALVTVHLESIIISPPTNGVPDYRLPNQPIYHRWKAYTPPLPPAEALLRLPAVTMLVLDRCNWKDKDGARGHYIADKTGVVPVQIDAPKLRRFRYKGLLRPFSLSPRPPDLAHADLHFVPHALLGDRVNKILPGHKETNEDPCRGEANLKTFWRFLHNFTGVKELKLNVNHLEDMAVLSEARRAELLPAFSILERLELHRAHRPNGKTATVAIADLLRCCPTLRSLRINHTAVHQCTTTHSIGKTKTSS